MTRQYLWPFHKLLPFYNTRRSWSLRPTWTTNGGCTLLFNFYVKKEKGDKKGRGGKERCSNGGWIQVDKSFKKVVPFKLYVKRYDVHNYTSKLSSFLSCGECAFEVRNSRNQTKINLYMSIFSCFHFSFNYGGKKANRVFFN